MSDQPIGDHALLSDCHSAALVDRRGSVEWLCMPRFDSPSVFGRLLDDRAGHFLVGPTGPAEVTRRYLDGTLVLTTTFRTAGGTVELTDALLVGAQDLEHDLGAGSPHVLARRAECVHGEVDLEVEFAPRPEYGLVGPLLCDADGGLVARGGASALVLTSPVALDVEGSVARGRVRLRAGDTAAFAVEYASAWVPAPRTWSQREVADRIDNTVGAWRTWEAAHQNYTGPWADLVRHSGRVLQGLTYQPSGAIVAAATTSLPETVGGERNWDYRFSWVRDASLTLDALWVAACPDEAGAFIDYLTTAAATSITETRRLQIMFGIGGEHDLTERELSHLAGWRDSRPVRVGNGAWDQVQLDVYGELLLAVHRLRAQLGEMDGAQRAFLVALADTAAEVWRDTDQGIWEIRGEPRHFLYSKLMCWVALDRAVSLADQLDAADRVPAWTRVRDEIAAAILDEGWSDSANAFTQSFGDDALDASNLVMPVVGFLPADDPRMLATIAAIEADLTDERGLVYRYRGEDGLEGEEGTFLLCTFWLAQAKAMAGRVEDAREVFERAVGYINDVGLLAEEVDPGTGELLGNFPQAFSHIGLVNAAWAIAQAEERAQAGAARP